MSAVPFAAAPVKEKSKPNVEALTSAAVQVVPHLSVEPPYVNVSGVLVVHTSALA